MKPTLISGQSVCSGCGFEFMSCGRLSLLTNVTREPAATVMVFGETPAAVIVIVPATVPPPPPPLPPAPPEGLLGLSLPPHADASSDRHAHAITNARIDVIGRTSSRC